MTVVGGESDRGGVIRRIDVERAGVDGGGDRFCELLPPTAVRLTEPLADFRVTQRLRPELEKHGWPLRRSVVREEALEHAADGSFGLAVYYGGCESVCTV